jgi:hypothetical protein
VEEVEEEEEEEEEEGEGEEEEEEEKEEEETGVSDERGGERSAAATGVKHAMCEAAGLCEAGVAALRCERGVGRAVEGDKYFSCRKIGPGIDKAAVT